MITGKAQVRCPFCEKIGIVAFYKPPHREPSSSRISGKSVTKQILKDESYYIQSGCPHCDAKKKDIQDYYDGKYKKKSIVCGLLRSDPSSFNLCSTAKSPSSRAPISKKPHF